MDIISGEEESKSLCIARSMYKRNINTDVTVRVIEQATTPSQTQEVSFPAHKILLSIVSPVLAIRLRSTFSDTLTLNDVSVRGFKYLLGYMYNKDLQVESVKDLVEVAKAAKCLEVGNVVRGCKYKLDQYTIDKDNVFSILEASKYFKMDLLLALCLEFCLDAPKSNLLKSPGLLEVNRDTMSLILKERLFSSEREADAMEAAIRWIKHHNCRDRELLSKIHVFSLNCNEFLDILDIHPGYFTWKEIASILENILRPGSVPLPPWCETTQEKCSNHSLSYDLLAAKSLKVKMDCNRPFLKSYFYGEDGFEVSVTVQIKLEKTLHTHPSLVMLELAFGTSYVPEENLHLDLEQENPLKKKKIAYRLQATSEHYYLIINQMRLLPNRPLVFNLNLKVAGLKGWEDDGPVSDGKYRVAQICDDTFYNVQCVNERGCVSACLTPLGDWVIFLDPVLGEKKHIVTSFYFDSLTSGDS